jgi:hypothetical protein
VDDGSGERLDAEFEGGMRKLEDHEEELDPVKVSSIAEEKARQLYRKSSALPI